MRHFTREPVNVDDLKARDRIVRRFKKLRADAVQSKNNIEHWNELNPTEPPISTAFEDSVIAYCDGKGPMPTLAALPTQENTKAEKNGFGERSPR